MPEIKLKPNWLHIYWIIQDVEKARKVLDSIINLPRRENALRYKDALQDVLETEQALNVITHVLEVDRDSLKKQIKDYFKEIGFTKK